MIKFLSSTTKGLTFVWVVLIASSRAEKSSVDLDALYTIFEAIAKPLLQSVQVQYSNDDESKEQDDGNNILEPEIKEKSEKLSFVPNYHISNDIPVNEDSEETIILEIPSSEIHQNRRKGDVKDKDTNNDSYGKYKELQQKIGSLLNKERISDKTKDLLSNAFEKVINQINKPCVSNSQSANLTPKMNRRLMKKLDRTTKKTMLKVWKRRFNDLIDQYREEDTSETYDSNKNWKFLSKLQDFFFEMHNNFQNLTRRYDFSCNVVNVKKVGRSDNKNTVVKKIAKSENKSTAGEHSTNSISDKNLVHEKSAGCQFQKICPYELKIFLTDFYKALLDKVNLVFHNYIKMYFVDMSKESSSERKMFMRVMDAIRTQVKKKYNETITKEKGKIVLDSGSDINVKVANINKVIDKTVAKVKTLIEFALTDKGRTGELPSKIQSAVKSDIMTNADIEMSEVKEKFKANMCKSFETCYGKERRKKHNIKIFED